MKRRFATAGIAAALVVGAASATACSGWLVPKEGPPSYIQRRSGGVVHIDLQKLSGNRESYDPATETISYTTADGQQLQFAFSVIAGSSTAGTARKLRITPDLKPGDGIADVFAMVQEVPHFVVATLAAERQGFFAIPTATPVRSASEMDLEIDIWVDSDWAKVFGTRPYFGSTASVPPAPPSSSSSAERGVKGFMPVSGVKGVYLAASGWYEADSPWNPPGSLLAEVSNVKTNPAAIQSSIASGTMASSTVVVRISGRAVP